MGFFRKNLRPRDLGPMVGIVLQVAVSSLMGACAGSSSGGGAKNSCPESVAASSQLSLKPEPASARLLHADGAETTWNWQLKGALNSSYDVDVYDVDLFDTDADTIAAMKASGRKVVCYFSAGSSEDWRSDFSEFATEDLGIPLGDWEGERWLDIRSQNVLDIMTARLDLAVSKGCDGVEPDNVDGFTQDSCFPLTASDQLTYNRAIANLARERGLSVGLKNDPDQVIDLVSYYDFSVSEQCHEFEECERYRPFVLAGKPVFNAEYSEGYRSGSAQATLCQESQALGIRTLVLALDLDDSFRYSCD